MDEMVRCGCGRKRVEAERKREERDGAGPMEDQTDRMPTPPKRAASVAGVCVYVRAMSCDVHRYRSEHLRGEGETEAEAETTTNAAVKRRRTARPMR